MKNKIPTLLALSFAGLSVSSLALAQDATPAPTATPKFAGGTITGDAANGGPVGSVSTAEVGSNGYNTGGDTGGSTANTATPTPSATPHHTPHHQPMASPTPGK